MILPAAIAIIFNEDKTELLLIKRKDIPIWVLPGGGVEPNEDPEAAVIRESLEETGLVVDVVRKCAEYTPQNKLGSFTTTFICTIKSGNARLTEESAAISFFPLNSLPLLLFPLHKRWVLDALSTDNLIQKPLEGATYQEALKFLLRHPWIALRYLWTRFVKPHS